MPGLLAALLAIIAGTIAITVPGGSTPAFALTNCTVTSDSLDSQEQAFLSILNSYRAQNGAAALSVSPNLNRAAAWMAEDLGGNGYFSHTDSLGRSPTTRAQNCGYASGAGENIAAGTSLDTAQEAFDLWRNSSGHNANMLNGSYNVIGIARANIPGSPYGWYWVTDFGSYNDSGSPSTPTATATATTTPPPAGDVALTSGVPVTGQAVSQGAWKYYSITVPAGATQLKAVISGGTGDADLYVRQGSKPTTSTYACRPYVNGNSESCTLSSPAADTWWIGVRGYAAASGLSLTVTVSAGGAPTVTTTPSPTATVTATATATATPTQTATPSPTTVGGDLALSSGVPVTGQSVAKGSWKYYSIPVPSGATKLLVTISGGTGDADLYVQPGSKPTTSAYACRPYLNGNSETCTLSNPVAGTWWVAIRGYAAASGVTVKATVSGP